MLQVKWANNEEDALLQIKSTCSQRIERGNNSDEYLGNSDETQGGALSPVHKTKIWLCYLVYPGYQKGIS